MSRIHRYKDHLADGRLRKQARPTYPNWIHGGPPRWFRKVTKIKPRRQQNKLLCRRALDPELADDLNWPLANRPIEYYW